MKTLTLVSAASTRPPREDLVRMELADEYPRATLFGDVLNSDILDLNYLTRLSKSRQKIYRYTPVMISQILEAFTVRKEYDAIISWSEKLGLIFALLLKLTHQRIPHIGIWSWISKPKKITLLKITQNYIDKILLMSSNQYNFTINNIGIPKSKVVLLKWPIDQRFWRPLNRKQDMICTVGREMRDFKTFIDAMSESGIKCHIAASEVAGKNDPWLKDLKGKTSIGENITIGKKSYAELRELYARSRFIVVPLYPTDTDNGTTTILEAMAMGKAVICSQVEGQKDVIIDGKTGIFVPPQNTAALREAIQHLWENPEIAESMGQEGRKYIEQYHTVDNWVNSVKDIVQCVVESKSFRSKIDKQKSNIQR